MQISLSQKQSDAWHELNNPEVNEVLYGGSAGGGKSMLGCVWHINQRMQYAGSRGLIGRSKIKALEESTLVTLFEIAGKMGYKSGVHYDYNSQKHRITWSNGSVSLLKDLFQYPSDPDYTTSLGSTEFTDAFIDEVTEIPEKAVQIVASRIRWKLKQFNLTPKILMSCNPSPGWVRDKWVFNEQGRIKLPPNKRFIQATVFDNPDKDFLNLYVKQLSGLNEYDKQRLLYGNWEAKEKVLNPFASNFDRSKHVADVSIDPSKPLLLSIDFNLNPFGVIAAQIWKDSQGNHCHIVDEIEIYKGSIPDMIDEFKKRYSRFIPSVQITGDSMGNRGDISQRDNANYYEQIRRALNISTRQLKVYPNPSHSNSRADVNYVLYHFDDFKISKNCKQTIFDFENVECDAFGSILKRNRTDLSQRADMLDGCRYLINAFLKQWIIYHQKSIRNAV